MTIKPFTSVSSSGSLESWERERESPSLAQTTSCRWRHSNHRLLPLTRPDTLPGSLPLINPYHEPNLLHAAWAAGIPTFAVAQSGFPVLARFLAEKRTDAVCVACFPWKLPVDLVECAPSGFLNVHPSLLPHYRGPAPLFWLFQRDDQKQRGVTIHLMDQGLDTGPIVHQRPLAFENGLEQREVERTSGELGGELLAIALDNLASGGGPRPQGSGGSYYPWPEPEDYSLDLSWSARRAFNFMRATNGAGAVYPLHVRDRRLTLVQARGFDQHGRQESAVVIDGMTAHIQFSSGILEASLSPYS